MGDVLSAVTSSQKSESFCFIIQLFLLRRKRYWFSHANKALISRFVLSTIPFGLCGVWAPIALGLLKNAWHCGAHANIECGSRICTWSINKIPSQSSTIEFIRCGRNMLEHCAHVRKRRIQLMTPIITIYIWFIEESRSVSEGSAGVSIEKA